jgi:hypothetical protein
MPTDTPREAGATRWIMTPPGHDRASPVNDVQLKRLVSYCSDTVQQGVEVVVEKHAGSGASFPDGTEPAKFQGPRRVFRPGHKRLEVDGHRMRPRCYPLGNDTPRS